jgi:hypothetical protein
MVVETEADVAGGGVGGKGGTLVYTIVVVPATRDVVVLFFVS